MNNGVILLKCFFAKGKNLFLLACWEEEISCAGRSSEKSQMMKLYGKRQ